uniref:Uncharacterized protein n=1 Tax=Chromera velia CCMP2878 TaxID=1169474 RepID=A0A0G4FVQ4_9ALVE|eukprot:Cvel_18920.t1-p1 / transcript=Cvel_18920.t1 / gene=Cvel_18920 / organism=Chromera_velia_CCMP2878 / gene_product=Keratin-associated protein 4-7, putative / transcript_product=Keratin-associated protein 4-7, putative / location=Cvel_scaffold1595:26803-32188(-) / protein_length=1572 / sequence_SO=supercontig / SO=protein_coding / is_pseudo=false
MSFQSPIHSEDELVERLLEKYHVPDKKTLFLSILKGTRKDSVRATTPRDTEILEWAEADRNQLAFTHDRLQKAHKNLVQAYNQSQKQMKFVTEEAHALRSHVSELQHQLDKEKEKAKRFSALHLVTPRSDRPSTPSDHSSKSLHEEDPQSPRTKVERGLRAENRRLAAELQKEKAHNVTREVERDRTAEETNDKLVALEKENTELRAIVAGQTESPQKRLRGGPRRSSGGTAQSPSSIIPSSSVGGRAFAPTAATGSESEGPERASLRLLEVSSSDGESAAYMRPLPLHLSPTKSKSPQTGKTRRTPSSLMMELADANLQQQIPSHDPDTETPFQTLLPSENDADDSDNGTDDKDGEEEDEDEEEAEGGDVTSDMSETSTQRGERVMQSCVYSSPSLLQHTSSSRALSKLKRRQSSLADMLPGGSPRRNSAPAVPLGMDIPIRAVSSGTEGATDAVEFLNTWTRVNKRVRHKLRKETNAARKKGVAEVCRSCETSASVATKHIRSFCTKMRAELSAIVSHTDYLPLERRDSGITEAQTERGATSHGEGPGLSGAEGLLRLSHPSGADSSREGLRERRKELQECLGEWEAYLSLVERSAQVYKGLANAAQVVRASPSRRQAFNTKIKEAVAGMARAVGVRIAEGHGYFLSDQSNGFQTERTSLGGDENVLSLPSHRKRGVSFSDDPGVPVGPGASVGSGSAGIVARPRVPRLNLQGLPSSVKEEGSPSRSQADGGLEKGIVEKGSVAESDEEEEKVLDVNLVALQMAIEKNVAAAERDRLEGERSQLELQSKAEEMEDRIEFLENQVEEQKAAAAAQQAQVEAELQKGEGERSVLQTEISSLRDALSLAQQSLVSLQQQKEAAEEGWKVEKEEGARSSTALKRKHEEEVAALTQQVSSLQRSLSQAEQSLVSLQQQKEAAEEGWKVEKEEGARSSTALKRKHEEGVAALTQQVSSLQRSLSQAEQSLVSLQQEKEAAEEGWSVEKEEGARSSTALKRKHEEEVAALTQQVSSLQRSLSQAEQSLVSLQQEKEAAEEGWKVEKEEGARSSTALKRKHEEEVAALTQQVSSLQRSLSQAEQSLVSLQQEKEAAEEGWKVEKEEGARSSTALKRKHEEEVAALSREMTSLQSALSEAQSALACLREERKAKEAEISALRSQLASLQSSLSVAEKALASLKEERKVVEEKWKGEKETAARAREDARLQQEREMESLREQMSSLQDALCARREEQRGESDHAVPSGSPFALVTYQLNNKQAVVPSVDETSYSSLFIRHIPSMLVNDFAPRSSEGFCHLVAFCDLFEFHTGIRISKARVFGDFLLSQRFWAEDAQCALYDRNVQWLAEARAAGAAEKVPNLTAFCHWPEGHAGTPPMLLDLIRDVGGVRVENNRDWEGVEALCARVAKTRSELLNSNVEGDAVRGALANGGLVDLINFALKGDQVERSQREEARTKAIGLNFETVKFEGDLGEEGLSGVEAATRLLTLQAAVLKAPIIASLVLTGEGGEGASGEKEKKKWLSLGPRAGGVPAQAHRHVLVVGWDSASGAFLVKEPTEIALVPAGQVLKAVDSFVRAVQH